MANAFKNTTLVTKFAVKEFLNALQMGNKVDRQLDDQFRKVGDTISVRRPVMFAATSGATISSAQDIEEATVTVQLTERKKVNFEITSQDMTLEIDAANERYIRPAMEELAQDVETFIASKYTDIYNFVGTPGTTPSTFLDVANAGAKLSKLGVPMSGDWSAFYDPDASVSLANGLKGVFPQEIATRALKEASIGRYAKFNMFENQSLASHTVGVNTGTPLVNGASQEVTYATAKDSDTQSLITDGWTNSQTGILLAGDVFTIAGVNSVNRRTRTDSGELAQFVVTADANSGASTGPATFTISPPIIITGPYQTVTASPADDAVITVLTGTGGTSHRQNLGWHPNAITLAMAPLDMPTDGATSARESFKNVSIRSVRQYDITNDKTIFRFDILYGVVVQNRGFAVRTTG
ncbi:MAG: P22 phage major capsid protein family protein [Nitrosomonadaceae bacterium]